MLQARAIEEAAARVAAVPDRGDEAPGEPPGLTAAQRSAVNAQIEAGRADLHANRARALAQILPGKIEEALLAQRMRRTLETEQLERLDGMVARAVRGEPNCPSCWPRRAPPPPPAGSRRCGRRRSSARRWRPRA